MHSPLFNVLGGAGPGQAATVRYFLKIQTKHNRNDDVDP